MLARKNQSALLIAPTGAGKTLAGFLPSLIELHQKPIPFLHTLYISPLKALTNDIERNLARPVREMDLKVRIESRTGDTSFAMRKRQVAKPPHILLTTPESLALLLSYPDAFLMFDHLRTVVIDEIHSFVQNKRGDQTSLLLERLQKISPAMRRVGLSATVAHPQDVAQWLGSDVEVVRAKNAPKPKIKILYGEKPLPIAGHYPVSILKDVYEKIREAKSSIVFVNTRAQAEVIFQRLWEMNTDDLPIALHHGSLTRLQRNRVEAAMAEGRLRCVVATASLDLGIDWGDVSLVINIGTPKGISRLLQRVGRSNHRLNEPSEAWLVPTNRFEVLECIAALEAINENKLDDPPPNSHGAFDVLCQHIVNCACSAPVDVAALYKEVKGAYPFRKLARDIFDDAIRFVIDGGYVLKSYDRWQRLKFDKQNMLVPANKRIVQRHRMNIGTIVEAEKLKILKISKSKKTGLRRGFGGVPLGEVEERLILNLNPGDTFVFAGQVLRFEGIRDMKAEVTAAKDANPKIPAFTGGGMPLSTFLAQQVRHFLHDKAAQKQLPAYLHEWLSAQAHLSKLPPEHGLLAETFSYSKMNYLVAYPFAGRAVHQTLGFVLTNRMESLNLHPLGFTVSDYGFAIWGLQRPSKEDIKQLFDPGDFEQGLEDWIGKSAMLKRFFRKTAVVSGLIERKLPGAHKTGKQVTFSSDLIYDVLKRYEPGHILLKSSRLDAEKELADIERVREYLAGVKGKIILKNLPRISPFAIPIVLEVVTEGVTGLGKDLLLGAMSTVERSERLYEEALHE